MEDLECFGVYEDLEWLGVCEVLEWLGVCEVLEWLGGCDLGGEESWRDNKGRGYSRERRVGGIMRRVCSLFIKTNFWATCKKSK